MALWKRIAIAALLVVIDLVAFAVPLMALAAAYVVVARPPGFLRWVLAVYEPDDRGAEETGPREGG